MHTESPVFSYSSEIELSAVVNLVYLAARDKYRVEREDKAGKGYADFMFYPESRGAFQSSHGSKCRVRGGMRGKMENIAEASVTRQLMKELKFTRIICLISSALTLCLLAGGVLLYGRVQELAEICEPVVEQVSRLDVEGLNSTMDNINDSLEAVDWQQVSDALGELDVEALNSAIEGLDTAELTESLQNLNDAVDTVKGLNEKLSEKMNSLSSLFGGMFH